ncbi:ABC transporter permease [Micromonospora sp. BQ11]|uniref:ABC transporter permease n=1 Tax=Micromonospora sp. BQ11 TaxID=3452212 RepID=UPI003F8AC3B1
MLGTVLGVGSFVAVLGVTASTASQIGKQFTVLSATEVLVEQIHSPADIAGPGLAFPTDADARVGSLAGVRSGGVLWVVDGGDVGAVSSTPVSQPKQNGGVDQLSVIAASPGALNALHPVVSIGRTYDEFHERRGEHVAVLGAGAARRLGINRLDAQPAIFVGDKPLTVVGVIDDVERRPEVLLSVIVPRYTAETLWGPPENPPAMLIDTELGAAQTIGRQVALSLRPDAPELFKVTVPPHPQALREAVENDLAGLFLILAAVCLFVGTAGIANTTLVAVVERMPEIGLRRAIGARRRHIAAQFLVESTVCGLLGGLVGSSCGVVLVLALATVQDWTAVVPTWTTIAAPLIGALTGLVAGLYPALRAARLSPIETIRR